MKYNVPNVKKSCIDNDSAMNMIIINMIRKSSLKRRKTKIEHSYGINATLFFLIYFMWHVSFLWIQHLVASVFCHTFCFNNFKIKRKLWLKYNIFIQKKNTWCTIDWYLVLLPRRVVYLISHIFCLPFQKMLSFYIHNFCGPNLHSLPLRKCAFKHLDIMYSLKNYI